MKLYRITKLLKKKKKYESENFILVCGPSGNKFTRYIFNKKRRDGSKPITQIFNDESELERILENPETSQNFKAPNPVLNINKECKEYALIARHRNPWNTDQNREKYIFVFAGVWSLGTHFTGDLLSNMFNYSLLPWRDREAIVVAIEFSYVYLSPYNFKCTNKRIIKLIKTS